MRTLSLCLLFLSAQDPLRWYKGNVHTHTLWSDGDSAPEMVADWYQSHDYHFLVISDHNTILDGEKWIDAARMQLEAIEAKFGKDWTVRKGKKVKLKTLDETWIEAEGKRTGRPILGHLNHPNFQWAITPDDVAHVLEERFFEVYNGHAEVNNYGDKDHPGAEALRLSELKGPPIYALAVDDAHHFQGTGVAPPGRGWIYVRAPALSTEAILKAMHAGDFYASSGVELLDIVRTDTALKIKIKTEPGVRYTNKFIGANGDILRQVPGADAEYTFKGKEVYVRATIVSDKVHPNPYRAGDVETAWVQPVVR